MKGIVVAFLGLTLGVYGMAYAEFVPECVQCFGTPECPGCCSGYYSGAATCWVTGDHRYTDGDCYYAYGPGCFAAGTPIETPDGDVAIEDLHVGDKVLGLSDEGKAVANEVVETYRTLAVEYFVINGEISVPGTHPFLVGGDWVEAQHIRVGDILAGPDGTAVPVSSVEAVDYGVRVYNISVSGNRTLFAGGILVHNKGEDPDPTA